jgi:DNA-binding NtrC family response regulator
MLILAYTMHLNVIAPIPPIQDERNDANDDEQLAARHDERTLLISAGAATDVKALARRIHAAGVRASFPFVDAAAGALPLDPAALRRTCAGLLDAAGGGSLLLTDIECTPAAVQHLLMDVLAQLQSARAPSARARLIAGTTVPLYERAVAGLFSERLFYRLNTIHLSGAAAA